MDIVSAEIQKLIASIEIMEKEYSIPLKQRQVYDKMFMNRIDNLHGDFDLNTIMSAIKDYHYVDVDNLCNNVLPTNFNCDKCEEFLKLFRFVATYTCFNENTKSESIASAIHFSQNYLMRLHSMYADNQCKEIIDNGLQKDKADFMEEIFLMLDINIPHTLIEHNINDIDELTKDNASLNSIFDYYVKSMKLEEFSQLMNSLNLTILPEDESIDREF